jgi:mannose-1-phosphate guanylyltransferase
MQQSYATSKTGALQQLGLKHTGKDPVLCGLVLAGGEGKRLRPFVHLLRGDLLPKQYVNFIGRRSMLEHTLARAEKLIPAQNVFTIVNDDHLAFPDVRRQVAARTPDTVIIQPENKETAPGILFGLMHIAKRHPNSIVAVLPSDHFVLEEEELVGYLKYACRFVKCDPSRIVLLGIEPDCEESEYGYIVPGGRVRRRANPVFQISSFVEKPDYDAAQRLARAGALWNTMMMVFNTSMLLHLIETLSPALFRALRPIYRSIGTPDERAVTEATYQELLPVNFSKEILEPLAREYSSQLVTFPVRNVLWSDWGSESRVMEILRKIGCESRLNGLAKASHAIDPFNYQPRSIESRVRTAKHSSRPKEPLPIMPGSAL